MTNEVDKTALKLQALLEKIANMTAQYENQVADLRVELTVSEQRVNELEGQVAQAQAGTKKK